MTLQFAQRCRPYRGEIRSGDAAFVRTDGDTSLLALVDALGHGVHAADVAERAVEFLRDVPLSLGVRRILGGLHEALRASRGAAATVCLVRRSWIQAAGVGNVSLRVFGSSFSLMLTPGIVGSRMRDLKVFDGNLTARTRLVLHSDGIRARFSAEEVTRGTPEEACESIFGAYARTEDDATVLIADLS